MNNEEAQYTFRRTVAEVLKTLVEPEGAAVTSPVSEFDISAMGEEGEPGDGE